MNIKVKFTAFMFLSLTLATACAPVNRAMTTLNFQAGKSVDEGNFGDPTYNNTLAQSAYRGPNGVLLDLSHKFEKDVPTMIHFDFGSARLDATSRAILAKQANWIRQFPEIRFRVYGHTDLVGTAAYNKRLGMRRARRVVNFLVSHGISRRRLEAVVSFGETQPLVVTEGRERRNRRTVTQVIGFSRGFVGDGLDGKYARLVYRTYVGSGSSATATTTAKTAN